jgi:hypothetical protein
MAASAPTVAFAVPTLADLKYPTPAPKPPQPTATAMSDGVDSPAADSAVTGIINKLTSSTPVPAPPAGTTASLLGVTRDATADHCRFIAHSEKVDGQTWIQMHFKMKEGQILEASFFTTDNVIRIPSTVLTSKYLRTRIVHPTDVWKSQFSFFDYHAGYEPLIHDLAKRAGPSDVPIGFMFDNDEWIARYASASVGNDARSPYGHIVSPAAPLVGKPAAAVSAAAAAGPGPPKQKEEPIRKLHLPHRELKADCVTIASGVKFLQKEALAQVKKRMSHPAGLVALLELGAGLRLSLTRDQLLLMRYELLVFNNVREKTISHFGLNIDEIRQINSLTSQKHLRPLGFVFVYARDGTAVLFEFSAFHAIRKHLCYGHECCERASKAHPKTTVAAAAGSAGAALAAAAAAAAATKKPENDKSHEEPTARCCPKCQKVWLCDGCAMKHGPCKVPERNALFERLLSDGSHLAVKSKSQFSRNMLVCFPSEEVDPDPPTTRDRLWKMFYYMTEPVKPPNAVAPTPISTPAKRNSSSSDTKHSGVAAAPPSAPAVTAMTTDKPLRRPASKK